MNESSPTSRPSTLDFLKQAGVLWLGGMVGFFCVLPYLSEMKGKSIAESAAEAGMTAPALLAMAMLAHFSADIVLHVIPLLLN